MSRDAARSFSAIVTRAISVWGLLLLFILLVIVFSWLRPDTFLTYFNIRSILSNKSVQLLVALSVFIPMVANQFDLSAGFNVGISQVLAIGLQGQGLPWWAAVCAVLLMGAAVGLANGLLITRVKIDSFIATLGTGTILYGLNAWYTGGQQVLASLPPEFLAISGSVWIVPAPAIYALVVSLTLWIVFEYLPLGRYLYVLGASPRAAELNGISAKRYITLGFVAAGTLAAFAGVVLQSQLQVGQSSVGQEYLLPAFTAALLGATSIRPGRVNVWGTVLAVAVLAVTVAGLNQLGAPFFVEPLFNGSMLILAVGLAVQAAERRQRRGTQAEEAAAAARSPRSSNKVIRAACPALVRDRSCGSHPRERGRQLGPRHAGDRRRSIIWRILKREGRERGPATSPAFLGDTDRTPTPDENFKRDGDRLTQLRSRPTSDVARASKPTSETHRTASLLKGRPKGHASACTLQGRLPMERPGTVVRREPRSETIHPFPA